jgi:hypothetical protein
MSTSKRDLIEAIVELREDVERQLKLNKYYIAMGKLDELLAALKPLESIELSSDVRTDGTVAAETAPAAEGEAPPASEPEAPSERTWSGVVQETVVDDLRAN